MPSRQSLGCSLPSFLSLSFSQGKVITRILLLICLSVGCASSSSSSPSSSFWSLIPLSGINDTPGYKVNLNSWPFISSDSPPVSMATDATNRGISRSIDSSTSPPLSSPKTAPRASDQGMQQQQQSKQRKQRVSSNIWNNLLPSSLSNYLSWLQSPEEYTGYVGSNKQDIKDLTTMYSYYYDEPTTTSGSSGPGAQIADPYLSTIDQIAKKGREMVTSFNALSMFYDSVVQTMTCLANDEFSDPDLGRFDMNASLYCNIACGRAIPGVLCCNPSRPEMLDVWLRLKIDGQEEQILNFRDPSHVKFLSAPGKVVFVVHGFMERMSAARWPTEMRDGFSDLGHNAILVDWRHGNAGHYWQAIANVRVVAAIIGRAILNWGIADNTLIVGFSLGAQIAGEAGRYTQTYGNVVVNECHGLDPAGPFYDGCLDEILLDKTDCRVVQAVHTSAEDVRTIGPLAMRFGTYRKTGHCDYWVNCGYSQGLLCHDIRPMEFMKAATRLAYMSDGEFVNWAQSQICGHARAYEVYISALKGRCDFPAFPCPLCGKFGSAFDCMSKAGDVRSNNTLPPFATCDPGRDENYFVSSNAYEPYCEI